jgi:hypothetical protein
MIIYKTDTRATQSNKYPDKYTKCMVIKKCDRLMHGDNHLGGDPIIKD